MILDMDYETIEDAVDSRSSLTRAVGEPSGHFGMGLRWAVYEGLASRAAEDHGPSAESRGLSIHQTGRVRFACIRNPSAFISGYP